MSSSSLADEETCCCFNCSLAFVTSSADTPCVERLVSRARLACAFRCVSLSLGGVGAEGGEGGTTATAVVSSSPFMVVVSLWRFNVGVLVVFFDQQQIVAGRICIERVRPGE